MRFPSFLAALALLLAIPQHGFCDGIFPGHGGTVDDFRAFFRCFGRGGCNQNDGTQFSRTLKCYDSVGSLSSGAEVYIQKLDSKRPTLLQNKDKYPSDLGEIYRSQNQLVEKATNQFQGICRAPDSALKETHQKIDENGACELFAPAQVAMKKGILALRSKITNLHSLAAWFRESTMSNFKADLKAAQQFPFRHGTKTPVGYGTKLEGEIRAIYSPDGPLSRLASDIEGEATEAEAHKKELEEKRDELGQRLEKCKSMH